MDITCKNCNKPFNANPLEIASANVNFSLGRKHIFYCDHCKAENPLSKEEFNAIKEGKTTAAPTASGGVKPAAAPQAVAAAPAPKPAAAAPQPAIRPDVRPPAAAPAPNPLLRPMAASDVEKPAASQPKEGTVNVRSLRVRKDHNTSAEIVAGLSYGDQVKILSTWTDGKNTWAEIAPGQWAAIEHNGEKMIEVA